ncbi:MAG: carboxymuconolactone decarboxylase family protein [Prevotellaceae bacterium]|nr:carboxymuconolactone decarboxylase family protein [Prevotellaceae bacterium]
MGKSYLAPLTSNDALNCPVSNVTFEPGCRNNWHSHTGGQLLIAVAGKGYYQEKGQPARLLLPGDVVEIVPNVVHWHGAAPDSWFSHLAITTNPQNNQSTWLEPVDDAAYLEATAQGVGLTAEAKANLQAWYPADGHSLQATDAELMDVFNDFAFGQTRQYGTLDERTRIAVTMASAVAIGAKSLLHHTVEAALANGMTPLEIKEIVYHAVPYAGMSRVEDMLRLVNDLLWAKGIDPKLAPQAVVTQADRMEKGRALQEEIFGKETIGNMYRWAPANQLHIQQYLSANCFGDYQTRPALDKRQRELLTFAILVSLGGCEPQVKGHIAGNVNVDNDKDTLLAVVTQLLPYIGYPRTLNAIACLNEVIPEK